MPGTITNDHPPQARRAPHHPCSLAPEAPSQASERKGDLQGAWQWLRTMANQLQQLPTGAHDLWASPRPPTHEKRLRRTRVPVTMMNDHSPQARAHHHHAKGAQSSR
eukprot:15449115-Alexandrium_andersonii.AAC.1